MRTFARTRHGGNGGFTLVELMLAMVVSSVIILAIYAAQRAQQRAHGSQEQVADLQQSIRAAMTVMTNDIHMANFKPTGDVATDIIKTDAPYLSKTKFEIIEAKRGRFAFIRYVRQLDDEGKLKGSAECPDGECAQAVVYRLPNDDRGRGVVAQNATDRERSLYRGTALCTQENSWCANVSPDDPDDFQLDPVSRDFEAVEFVYHMCPPEDPMDSNSLRYYSGNVSLDPPKNSWGDICAVTVTLLLRSPVPDANMAHGIPAPKFASEKFKLINPARKEIANRVTKKGKKNEDEYRHRRRLYTTTVQLRNTHLIKSN